MITPEQALNWAIQLNAPFAELTAEQSWHAEKHLTREQLADHELATALYAWHSLYYWERFNELS